MVMDKKRRIFEAALDLFSQDGYSSTPTSKIAKVAGVSEGLIFRHFENKEGLLKAILKEGDDRFRKLFADIVFEPDPKELIRKVICVGLGMINSPKDINFWKLQFKIKWEIEEYTAGKLEPIELALANALSKLNYEFPEKEANLLLVHLDGLTTRFFLQKDFDYEGTVEYLLSKYV